MDLQEAAALDFCYLTTTGRRTGHPHTIEIWFGVNENQDRLFLLAGGGDQSDWVRNLIANPTVALRLGDHDMITKAHVVADPEEDAAVRQLLLEKYTRPSGDDLSEWAASALPIAVELHP
ncbi:MAG: nitroreductase family deazaflavin-dependent oxidoreductase [Actinomycetota bacterium]